MRDEMNHFYMWLSKVVCCLLLIFGFYYLFEDEVGSATPIFLLAIAFIVFGNLSRFKRFSGFGLQMEMWNDVQRQADLLVKKHEKIIANHAKEILWIAVMMPRWSSSVRWEEVYRKFEEIINEMGSDVEFAELRQNMDRMCLFDTVNVVTRIFRRHLQVAQSKATDFINQRHPEPIVDHAGYASYHRIFSETQHKYPDDPLIQDTAKLLLEEIERIELIFQQHFDVHDEFDQRAIELLNTASNMYNASPNPPSELISLGKQAEDLDNFLYK